MARSSRSRTSTSWWAARRRSRCAGPCSDRRETSVPRALGFLAHRRWTRTGRAGITSPRHAEHFVQGLVVVIPAAGPVDTEQVRSIGRFPAGLLGRHEISPGQRPIWRLVIGLALAVAD